jgi:hypothetical protein
MDPRIRIRPKMSWIRTTDFYSIFSKMPFFLPSDGAQEVAAALADQKTRYENRLKELQEQITQKAKEKMLAMKEAMARKLEAQEARARVLAEENRSLVERLGSVDQKFEQMEAVNDEEVRVYR